MKLKAATIIGSSVAFLAALASSSDARAQDLPEGDEPALQGFAHTVRSGDTLWDLCAKQLNSPWYWPKIWSYNPQLTNPHWIYPGNEIRFYPGDENLPTNVEVSRTISVEDEDGIPDALDPSELVKTVGSIEVGRVPPDSYWASFVGFVDRDQHQKSGQIVNAEEEAIMLADADRTYVKLKEAGKKGKRYAIYRVVREIEHPVTGAELGYVIEIIGGLEIVDTSPVVATGQIAQAFRPIERGDFVGEWPENFGTRVAPIANNSDVKGYIVETAGDVVGSIGEHHLVFIDKGRANGIQRGNTFDVLARGDLFTKETEGLPNEQVGQLMVVDVQENAATAIVTFALRELGVGDKIEMRRSGS